MGRRGNPNWIRAAEERRTLTVQREERTMRQQQNEVMTTISPVVGAVAGALGVVAGAHRLGIERQQVAIGAAALGLATAVGTSGWMHGIAVGVAAAGAAIVTAERLTSNAKKAPTPKRDAVGITREELQRTIAEFRERQRNATSAPATGGAESVQRDPVLEGPSSSANDLAANADSKIACFREIVAQLDDGERERLSHFIDAAPEETLEVAQQALVEMAPSDAVRYLREYVLPRVTA
jgi:hypothetical protein